MKLHCQITPEDYIRAQFLHLRPRPVIKWVGLLIVVAALALGIQQLAFPPSGTITWAPFAILGGLAYFAAIYGILLPLKTRKIYRQQKTLQEPYESEVTDEVYATVSVLGTTSMPWKEFHKYKMNKDMLLVYQSDVIYHMFPKRWFTEDQFTEFKAILQRQLGQPKV